MIAIDFFCGAGGFTRGLKDAGVDVVAGIDINECCAKSYTSNNLGAVFLCKDVRAIGMSDIKSIVGNRRSEDAVFVGCAPCQPFSQQRKGCSKSGDATVLSAFGRIVESSLPRAIIIENVPGLAKVPGNSTYNRFVRMLMHNGYCVASDVLDAKHYGVPQGRRRLVLLAVRGAPVSLPGPNYGGASRSFRTVRDAIEHFPALDAGQSDATFPNHVCSGISELNLKRLRHTPSNGGDRRAWPSELKLVCHSGEYKGHTDVYGRMAWDLPAPTLTGRCHSISNGRYGHPEQDRAISLREAAALQSFPDRYTFYGTLSQVAQQIGNAVPVRFAEVLAKHLRKLLDEPRVRSGSSRRNFRKVTA